LQMISPPTLRPRRRLTSATRIPRSGPGGEGLVDVYLNGRICEGLFCSPLPTLPHHSFSGQLCTQLAAGSSPQTGPSASMPRISGESELTCWKIDISCSTAMTSLNCTLSQGHQA
jgi:hypothetical protein